MSHTVPGFEQGGVERLDRGAIGKINALIAIGIGPDEGAEFRHAFDQRCEIVAALMAIAGMEQG